MKCAGGIVVALLVAMGCHAGSSPAIGSTSVVVAPSAPESGASRPRVARLFAGANGTCRVHGPGRVHCWGAVPASLVEMAKVHRATFVAFLDAAKDLPYCVVDDDGKGICARGCALAEKECQAAFVPVEGVHSLWRLESSIALTRGNGTGCNVRGEIRCGPAYATSSIEGLRDLRALALGANHGCAIRADGKVVCVGDDHSGQLGTGQLLASVTPVLVESGF